MAKRERPNSRRGESGHNQKQKFFRPNQYTKKFDKTLLKNIASYRLGPVSEQAFYDWMNLEWRQS